MASRRSTNAFMDHASGNDWLSALVDARLAQIIAEFPPPADSQFGCRLADIGDYLVRSLAILSQLAERLSNGPHISIYAIEGIEDTVERSDFSDLDLLVYMNSKHQSLRQLASHIQLAAQTIQSDWQQSREPPEIVKRLGKVTISSDSPYKINHDTHIQSENRIYKPSEEVSYTGPSQNAYAPKATVVDSPSSDESGYDVIQERLMSLSSAARGKGEFFCPLGIRCTKGGVSSNGIVIKFEQNSAFRSHLQKHEKAYKCGLPGCKNKKGFARSDQLRRHQETVSHHTLS